MKKFGKNSFGNPAGGQTPLRIVRANDYRKRRQSLLVWPIVLVAVSCTFAGWALGGANGIADQSMLLSRPQTQLDVSPIRQTLIKTPSGNRVSGSGACNIKGNISIKTRERIYHVPGQYYYQATKISPEYGERWFCTEEEARAAGWRKSGI